VHEHGRAERELVVRAARRLRQEAIRAGYAGLRDPQVAFGLALVLDELARGLAQLDEAVRRQTVTSCRALLREPDAGG
jgi:hypothetical protein